MTDPACLGAQHQASRAFIEQAQQRLVLQPQICLTRTHDNRERETPQQNSGQALSVEPC